MSDEEIGLRAVFDNDEFHKGAEDYNKDIEKASKNTSEAGSSMSLIWEGMAAVGQAAFAAIAVGVAAMAAELYLAYDAAADAEQILTKVAFIVDGTAARTGVATEEVLALADGMSKVVPFDDEVIAQAAAMGLTFDGVTEDNLGPLLSAAADLSFITGKDLPAQMKSLALAITDTDKAARFFKEANITLTKAEEDQLKKLGELGDEAGTTQFILDQLAKKGVLGLAEAMGETNKGQLTIMQTAIGNLQEALGGGFLDSLTEVFGRITEFANDPQTVQIFTDIGAAIGDFASTALSKIPDLIDIFDSISTWFSENKPLIVGILAALGVAIAAFGFTVAATAISTISALAPILIAMAVIGAGAALLYTAWTENWGGIQEIVGQAWATIQPLLQTLYDWLSINIPIALQVLSDFWTTVLLPAIEAVFGWIATNVIPLWISLVEWLAVNVPAAINTLSAIWTGTLLPAIQAVWGWISANIIPLFMAISNLISTVLGVALTALAGIWQNILLPALTAVGNWLTTNVVPILTRLGSIIAATLMPVLRSLGEFISGVLVAAFQAITDKIQVLIDWVNNLTDAFANVKLPDALTPGSPTPFEIGLKGINDQMKILSDMRLPALTTEFNNLDTRDVNYAGNGGSSNQAGTINNTSSSIRALLLGSTFQVDSPQTFFDIISELS
jgi:hypothetical protein